MNLLDVEKEADRFCPEGEAESDAIGILVSILATDTLEPL